MSFCGKVAATAQFDFRRSLTISRLSAFVVLSLFPPAIMAINLFGPGVDAAPVIIGVTVMMVGILAELLWATPIVYGELEGKTWLFLAVRPRGILAVLLGKYLVAALWTTAVCSIALTICALLTASAHVPNVVQMWFVFLILTTLAAFAYAAIFALIGVVFHRRAMVFAMAYVILFEVLVAQIPAVINQITVRHHITALAVKWLDFRQLGDEEVPDFILQQMLGAREPDWLNILMVAATTVIALAAAAWIICNREYLSADEV
jgi:ABC-type transport system involved in multi-copper enzyme maturation permease subunit